jgi:hypothetical protein
MGWLEIIELRSSEISSEKMEDNLRKLVKDFSRNNKELEIKAYNRIDVGTDSSIHILSRSKKSVSTASEIGEKLKTILKEYGYVSHRVWSELDD